MYSFVSWGFSVLYRERSLFALRLFVIKCFCCELRICKEEYFIVFNCWCKVPCNVLSAVSSKSVHHLVTKAFICSSNGKITVQICFHEEQTLVALCVYPGWDTALQKSMLIPWSALHMPILQIEFYVCFVEHIHLSSIWLLLIFFFLVFCLFVFCFWNGNACMILFCFAGLKLFCYLKQICHIQNKFILLYLLLFVVHVAFFVLRTVIFHLFWFLGRIVSFPYISLLSHTIPII